MLTAKPWFSGSRLTLYRWSWVCMSVLGTRQRPTSSSLQSFISRSGLSVLQPTVCSRGEELWTTEGQLVIVTDELPVSEIESLITCLLELDSSEHTMG